MKTGIFGGAFDPIHKGHIYMAQKAMEEYSLDRLFLVPSGHSPNKTENAMTAFSHRYNICVSWQQEQCQVLRCLILR